MNERSAEVIEDQWGCLIASWFGAYDALLKPEMMSYFSAYDLAIARK